MFVRFLIWGIVAGMCGMALVDKNSYDESGRSGLVGAVVGFLAGGLIAVAVEYIVKRWRRRERSGNR